MDAQVRDRVREHITEVMNRKIHKLVEEDPFDENIVAQNNPIGYSIVPLEVWIGSKFERSFVTM